MALDLGVKPSELQLNTPKNEGQNVPISFVGQKKLSEQPLVDQGIPTAPIAPKLETNEPNIDQIDSEEEREEIKFLERMEREGLKPYLDWLKELQDKMEARMNQEPIGLASSERVEKNQKKYSEIANKIFEINARTSWRINLNAISKVLVIPGLYEEIIKSLIGVPKLNDVFSPKNVAVIKAKGLSKEDLYNQLFEKTKIPEIINREPIQTPWGSAILEYLEYKEAA